MFYHCRDLKYVIYGKVYPPPVDKVDDFVFNAYRWLGHHCGFFPQVWLSRSTSSITGIRNSYYKDGILFGFEDIKGFPVAYDPWEFILNALMDEDKFDKQNIEIIKMINETIRDCRKEDIETDDDLKAWIDSGRNLDVFLKKHLFVLKDQVVIPSLNLKVAKKIICQNERQKKILRKMGFIEDRICIKNIKKVRF